MLLATVWSGPPNNTVPVGTTTEMGKTPTGAPAQSTRAGAPAPIGEDTTLETKRFSWPDHKWNWFAPTCLSSTISHASPPRVYPEKSTTWSTGEPMGAHRRRNLAPPVAGTSDTTKLSVFARTSNCISPLVQTHRQSPHSAPPSSSASCPPRKLSIVEEGGLAGFGGVPQWVCPWSAEPGGARCARASR